MWMKMRDRISATATIGLVAGLGVAGLTTLTAMPPAETFTATASAKSAKAAASAPVTIKIDRFVSDADRDKLLTVIKGHDGAATRKALGAMEDIGFIEVAQRRTPIKFAYARPSGGGRLITVVTAAPIAHLGAAAPDAKPKEGFDLALALLVLDAADAGDGELAPAAKVKVNESGAIVTEDYGSEVIRLTGIAKAK